MNLSNWERIKKITHNLFQFSQQKNGKRVAFFTRKKPNQNDIKTYHSKTYIFIRRKHAVKKENIHTKTEQRRSEDYTFSVSDLRRPHFSSKPLHLWYKNKQTFVYKIQKLLLLYMCKYKNISIRLRAIKAFGIKKWEFNWVSRERERERVFGINSGKDTKKPNRFAFVLPYALCELLFSESVRTCCVVARASRQTRARGMYRWFTEYKSKQYLTVVMISLKENSFSIFVL